MLTQNQLAVIQQTVPVLQENGEALTRHFYARMFRENPEVRPFFNPAHQQAGTQQRALAGAICAYAQHVDNPAALADAVELIAQKHVSLGIQPQHYPIVGANLLASIQEVLGIDERSEIIDAWAAAYGALADIFIGRENTLYQHQKEAFGWQGFKPFVVARREAESENIVSLYLARQDGEALQPHQPGQYITVRVTPPGGQPVMRNYSLSCAPGESHYRISVKRELATADEAPHGVCSGYIHEHIQEGDVLEVAPPCGEFTLADAAGDGVPLVLVAGGVGITPLLSMLHGALARQQGREVIFIQCAQNGAVRPFAAELQKLADSHDNLHCHVRYSEPSAQDKAQGGFDSTGFLDRTLLDKLVGERRAEYYFCGPVPMLKALYGVLQEKGVDDADIHYEFFGPAEGLAA